MIRLVTDKGNQITVDEKNLINQGGEGKIISIGNGMVVKLYFEANRAISLTKIRELSCLDDNLFIKPINSVSGDFNGYVMKELDNSSYYPLYYLYSENFCNKNSFPTDYKNVIANKMVAAVKNAHLNGVIIGDLNPFNIMVNNQLDVKFIDVDSYETKSSKHNDKLLEDIRDYKNGGFVNEKSDYFALAVCIFNLFTGIHPYKGIHNVYRDKLKEREINDLSLLNESAINDIKVPKFYKPISNKDVSNEFKDIFQNNERRLIDLNGKHIENIVFNNVIVSDDLIVTSIMCDNIVNVKSSLNFMCITTDTSNIVYSTPSKGVYMNLFKVTKDVNIILTDKYIYGLKGGKLKRYDFEKKEFIEITSFCLNGIYILKQYENILSVITYDNKFYTIYLDDTFCSSVKYTVYDVFSKSFVKRNGMIQNLGEKNSFLYNNGKGLSTVIYKNKLDDINQICNVGIVQYKEGNKPVYDLFSIDLYGKLKIKRISDNMPFTANDKFIIIYNDDKLRFIDKENLVEIGSFSANGVDAFNILSCKSGIICFDQKEVKLINTK